MNTLIQFMIRTAAVMALGTLMITLIPNPITESMHAALVYFLKHIGYASSFMDIDNAFDTLRNIVQFYYAVIVVHYSIFMYRWITG